MPLAVPRTHPVLPPATANLLCLAHPDDPQARDAARIAQCQERVARAWSAERPRRLLEAIRSGGCSALLSGGPGDAVTCRICPEGPAWEHVAGYYRGAKQKIYMCAEKEPSQQQVEDTLTHELVHAYDHCRFGQWLPFVGTQAPWALSCAAEACYPTLTLTQP